MLETPDPGRCIQTQMGVLVHGMSEGQENWGNWNKQDKKDLLDAFLRHFQWRVDDALDEKAIEQQIAENSEIFYKSIGKIYNDNLVRARKKANELSEFDNPMDWINFATWWLQDKTKWRPLCEYWSGEKWMNTSRTNMANRNKGPERAHHRGGSRSNAETSKKMERNRNKPISTMDLLIQTKCFPNGGWIDTKSQRVAEEYDAKMIERYGDNWLSDSDQSDDHDLWVESSGKKSHGRFYVVNSLIKQTDVRQTQRPQSSDSVGTSVNGCRRRMYSDDEINELLQKERANAASEMQAMKAEMEKNMEKKMEEKLAAMLAGMRVRTLDPVLCRLRKAPTIWVKMSVATMPSTWVATMTSI